MSESDIGAMIATCSGGKVREVVDLWKYFVWE
jgi:hypothetical protein